MTLYVNRSWCTPLIYGLCFHNFNLKYEMVCCIFNKIYIKYIIYSIYMYISLKCTQFLKMNAGNSLIVTMLSSVGCGVC